MSDTHATARELREAGQLDAADRREAMDEFTGGGYDPGTIPAPARHATHVVVDTIDGYTFVAGSDGQLFGAQDARDFAAFRNAERKPGHQTYRVFALVPDAEAQS